MIEDLFAGDGARSPGIDPRLIVSAEREKEIAGGQVR